MKWVVLIKNELVRILPAYLFFVISFNAINLTQALMYRHEGIVPFHFVELLIAAAIVAKVLAIVDHLPFINLFPKKPIVWNIMWKSILYILGSILIRVIIRLAPFIYEKQEFAKGFYAYLESIDLNIFIAIEFWYAILFFVYVSFREFFMKVGTKKSLKIFFGI